MTGPSKTRFKPIKDSFILARELNTAFKMFIPDYCAESSVYLNIGSGRDPGMELFCIHAGGGEWFSIEPFRGIHELESLLYLDTQVRSFLCTKGISSRAIKIKLIDSVVTKSASNTLHYGNINLATTIFPPIFDYIVSVAVLEHVENLNNLMVNNYHALKPGGYSLHWVDFRDHRDFNLPLEFLAVPTVEWQSIYEDLGHYPMGSQVRPSQIESIFRHAGFDVVNVIHTNLIDNQYLSNLIPRIARDFNSLQYSDLQIGGALYVLRR